MTSDTRPSYCADLFGTIWQTVDAPEGKVQGKSLADTLTMPLEEKLPRHLSDDQTEADKVLLDMLMDDIPRTIVRSIVRSDSYDILVPSNISTSPYIAISYADDTEEEQFAFVNDTCPSQDSDFLTIPPGVMGTDCEEDDSDES